MENPQSENTPNTASGKGFPVPKALTARYQDRAGLSHNIKIRNVSRGGVCVEDTIAHPVGTSLRFHLNFKGKTVQAQGEVTWNKREGSGFLHGIVFTFMEQEGRQWFNTFVMDWAAEYIAEELDFSDLEAAAVKSGMERRSYARLKIPLRADIGFNEDTILIQAEISDVSEGGLCLISNLELKKDQELYLRLWLNNQKFVPLMGAIRYCTKKTYGDKVLNFHGLEFTDKSASEVLREIKKFLDQKRSEMEAIEISLDEIIGQAKLPELP